MTMSNTIHDSYTKEILHLPKKQVLPLKGRRLVRAGQAPMTFIKVRPSSQSKVIAIPKRPTLVRPVAPVRPPIFKGAAKKQYPKTRRPPYALPIDRPILWNPSKRKPPLGARPFPNKKGTVTKKRPPIPVKKARPKKPDAMLNKKQIQAINELKATEKPSNTLAKEAPKKKPWSKKKKLMVAAGVVIVLSITGYMIYKKLQT